MTEHLDIAIAGRVMTLTLLRAEGAHASRGGDFRAAPAQSGEALRACGEKSAADFSRFD
jgi:hypothetical protein